MFAILSESPLVDRIGWTLLHSLWQFALVALSAAGIQSVMCRCSAAARYAVGISAMLLLLACPITTYVRLNTSFASNTVAVKPPTRIAVVTTPISSVVEKNNPDTPVHVSRTPNSFDAPPAMPSDPSGTISAVMPLWWTTVKNSMQPCLARVVQFWCFGMLAFAMRPLISGIAIHRIRTVGVRAVPVVIQAVLERTAARLDIRRTVQLLQSKLVQVPITVGFLRPVILLPMSVVSGLTANQLEAVLAHELAHIRRHDYLVNLLQTLVETLFFYHPFVWWLSHRVRNEREYCCDDLVISTLGNRNDYCRALLTLEELRGPAAALSLSARGGSLLARTQRIVGIHSDRPGAAGATSFGLSLLTVAIVALGLWASTQAGHADTPLAVVSEPRQVSERAAQLLRDEKFSELTKLFSSELASELSTNRLQEIWTGISSAAGPFERFRRPGWRRVGDRKVADQRASWDRAELTVGWLVDSTGQISGLQILDTPDRGKLPESALPNGGHTFGRTLSRLLAATGTVTVTVLDADGKPLPKANVTLWRELPASDPSPDDWRPNDGTCWRSLDGTSDSSPIRFGGLPAGRYRVSAILQDTMARRSGFGDPFTLVSDQAQLQITVQLQRGSRVVLRVLNEANHQVMPQSQAGLTRVEHDWPYGDFGLKNHKEGTWIAEDVPPGRYSANASQSPRSPSDSTYEVVGGSVGIEVLRAGEEIQRELIVRGRPLTEKELEQRWPWVVEGTVRDGEGRPLGNVEIWANAGSGTLRRTGSARSDENGNYRLRFARGILMFHEEPDPLDVQAGIIHAHLPGHSEANLCRQGDLMAANRRPKPNELTDLIQPERLIIAGEPRRIDFVMVPAVQLAIRLENSEREPLSKWRVQLIGDVMPPASSVVDSGDANEQGRIVFEDVPIKFPWRLKITPLDSRQGDISPLLQLKKAGNYEVVLRQTTDETTKLPLLEIVSIHDATRVDLRSELLVPDPRTAPPVSADKQAAARELLKRVAEVNHDWLLGPPTVVQNYGYRFQRPGKEPQRITVDPRSPKSWTDIRGTAYSPAAGSLVRFADKLVFRQYDERDGKTSLYYVAGPDCPALGMNYGIGVAGKYGPFVSSGFREGTLVIGTVSAMVLEHHTGDLWEKFDDFVANRDGHQVPTHVQILVNDKLIHDWRFAVYGPGLWLLDEAFDAKHQLLASVDQVQIDGQSETARQFPRLP